MKRFLLSIFLLFAASLLKGQDADLLGLQEIIAQVRKEFAPDRRTELFKVDVLSDKPLVLEVETTVSSAAQELKRRLAEEQIVAELSVKPLPAADLNGKHYGVATLSVCNSRFSPDHVSEMATQLLLGTPVRILKKERGYYLVRTPDNYLSWTDDAGVQAMDEAGFTRWQQFEKFMVTNDYGFSYSKPSKRSERVSDIVAGNLFQLVDKKKSYWKVKYPDGRLAYIPRKEGILYSKWVSKSDPSEEQILQTARKLVGIPYLWGGTSVKGMDCSGFTKMTYFLNGVILPRDASQQVLHGEKVDIYESDTVSIARCLDNLKPGDLLFFAAGKNQVPNPRITHTAIYLGNGKFIQSAGLVRVNSLLSADENYDAYQTRTLVSARRILSSIGSEGISRVDKHSFYSKNKHL